MSANMMVGLIRNKLLAILLGPSGVGLFAQLMGVQNLAAGLVPMGMQAGALKYIAKYRSQEPERIARFVSTTSKLFLLLSLVTVALCFVLIKVIAGWALDSTQPLYLLYLAPPILGVPLLVQSQLWLLYVQAGLEVKSYSKATVTSSVIGLLVLLPIVLIWRQAGAAAHLLLFALISYVVARLYANRSMTKKLAAELKQASFDFSVIASLGKFALANLPITAFALFVPFIVRSQIVHDLGFQANGIYQAVFAMSNQYILVSTMAMQTYSFPKISQLSETSDINTEVNNAVRASLLFATAGILVVLTFRDFLISLLFSHKFLPAVDLLPIQMSGDLIRSVAWALQLPLLPQERFRARAALAIMQNSVFLTVFYVAGADARLQGVVVANAAAWATMMTTTYIYTNRVNGYSFTRQNLRLLVTSFAAVAIVAFAPFGDLRWRLVSVVVFLLWASTSVSRDEWSKIAGSFRKRLGPG
ncbi:MAG: oligosaccharide flippase family protein [Armatimonadetes bacterium]|nr:oligosaccharide flippase family protein [Armatimonadota bacterium]